jgi:small subunit ribosomal protein S6
MLPECFPEQLQRAQGNIFFSARCDCPDCPAISVEPPHARCYNLHKCEFPEEFSLRHYELVTILSPMLNQDQATEAWGRIKEFIANRDGEIVREQAWGTRRLAYPIRKGSYNFLEGSYFLTHFSTEKSFNHELETFLRLDERILRSLVIATGPPPPAPPAPAQPAPAAEAAAPAEVVSETEAEAPAAEAEPAPVAEAQADDTEPAVAEAEPAPVAEAQADETEPAAEEVPVEPPAEEPAEEPAADEERPQA